MISRSRNRKMEKSQPNGLLGGGSVRSLSGTKYVLGLLEESVIDPIPVRVSAKADIDLQYSCKLLLEYNESQDLDTKDNQGCRQCSYESNKTDTFRTLSRSQAHRIWRRGTWRSGRRRIRSWGHCEIRIVSTVRSLWIHGRVDASPQMYRSVCNVPVLAASGYLQDRRRCP